MNPEKKKMSALDKDYLDYYKLEENQDDPLANFLNKAANSSVRDDILKKIHGNRNSGRAKNIATRSALIGSLGAGTGLGMYRLLARDRSLKGNLIAGGTGALVGGLGGAYLGNRYDRKVAEYADEPEEFLRRDARLKKLNETYKHIGSKINAYT